VIGIDYEGGVIELHGDGDVILREKDDEGCVNEDWNECLWVHETGICGLIEALELAESLCEG
jgi:hypothetical protein